MPDYMTIGGSVTYGKGLKQKTFNGPVVASEEAIFASLALSSGDMLASSLGGLVGFAAWAAVKKVKGNKSDRALFITDVNELPENIRHAPDWPMKKVKGNVLVLMRDEATDISESIWTGLKFKIDGHPILIPLGVFKHGKRKAFLQDNGWLSR